MDNFKTSDETFESGYSKPPSRFHAETRPRKSIRIGSILKYVSRISHIKINLFSVVEQLSKNSKLAINFVHRNADIKINWILGQR